MVSVICPICKKDDMIRKISSIIKEQTKVQETEGRISGEGVGIDSDLNVGIGAGGGTYKSKGYISSTLAMSLAPPNIGSGGGLQAIMALIGAIITTILFTSILGINSIIFKVIFFIISFFILFMQSFKIIPDNREKADKIVKKYSKNWLNLYYCFRDDIVFDPQSKSFSEPSVTSILKMLGATEEEIKKVTKYLKN